MARFREVERRRCGFRSGVGKILWGWSALSLVAMVVLTLVSSASAATPASVRERLRRAQLHPTPLYPAKLPAAIRRSNASPTLTGNLFSVDWNRGCCSAGVNRGYLTFGRAAWSQLADDLRIARSRGDTPHRVRVGHALAWHVCGHICGYDWHAQGFTYQAFGIYYARPGSENRDLRFLISHLSRLT